jgi:para-nitrobenzyl esterase
MSRFVAAMRMAGIILVAGVLLADAAARKDQATIESGSLQGTTNADRSVRIFKGVPFAAPPVGDLRGKAPQSAPRWKGVRQAGKFGSACLQTDVFGDINFRDNQPSEDCLNLNEDCLNLNVWIPARHARAKLPVFLWYYGGGFVAGANSEPRYDGENLAKKGIIVVEPNYRMSAFRESLPNPIC